MLEEDQVGDGQKSLCVDPRHGGDEARGNASVGFD